MKKKYNIRSICAEILFQVLVKKLTLNTALLKWQYFINDKDKKLLYEITFGSIRMFSVLDFFLKDIVKNSLKNKVPIIHYLLIIGIYQLYCTRIPEYAIISESVNASIILKHPKLKNLVNAVLREFKKKQNMFKQKIINTEQQYMHPHWLLKIIQKSYPKKWKKIIIENNKKPPMWIRVNQRYNTVYDYLKLLNKNGIQGYLSNQTKYAIKLQKSYSVNRLPGFNDGWVTVQDISSQKCVELLNPKNYEHILDLCAAPGIKTSYILEIAPKANVLSIDINKTRLKLIQDNFNRLNLKSNFILGDGCDPNKWALGKNFDRILLDVPCSSTGVIRRHPDIKWLKKQSDIIYLIKLQYNILKSIWPFLKTKGILAYVTCSILPDENKNQIEKFLSYNKDASMAKNITESIKQILPGDNDGDGFFYAFLTKIKI